MKDIWVKGISKAWFHSNIMEALSVRGKLKERFLRTKLVDYKRFKEQRNLVQQKIKNKKANFVRSALQKVYENVESIEKYWLAF